MCSHCGCAAAITHNTNGPHTWPICVHFRIPMDVMVMGCATRRLKLSQAALIISLSTVKDAIQEPVGAQILPDVLDRVQLGRAPR